MTPRERILRTLRFEPTDRAPFDLMEGCVWTELEDDFRARHGCQDGAQVIEFLDPDFRWVGMEDVGPQHEAAAAPAAATEKTYSAQVTEGPLGGAQTVAEVEVYQPFHPEHLRPGDFAAARRRWPDYALVATPGWVPLFWGACQAFGMETALIHMASEPKLFEAFVRCRHERYMDLLRRVAAAARGVCDLCWLGDDYASQQALIMGPELWRRRIKPFLAEQVRLLREHDLFVIFHSCGAVRDILPDLCDIGVNAHLVFQTTAAGMAAKSIAREFGGKLAFYGGIDIQQLLSFGTVVEVAATVRANLRAFEKCSGYIVANSHHSVATIKGENIEAMCRAARQYEFAPRR